MTPNLHTLTPWQHQLQQGDRGLKRNLSNLMLHLRHLDGLGRALAFNAFTQQIEWRGRPIEDADIVDIRLILERAQFQPIDRDVRPAIDRIARENPYDPIVDYLNAQAWDGTARLDRWMEALLGAPPTPFVRTISAKVLIAAVARAMRPGCQVDTVLVLEGEQGIRKSSAIATLFGKEYTRESVSLFDSHQRMVMNMLGAWVVELAERVAADGVHHGVIKGLITMRHDTVVLPYARSASTHPRRCVFFATVNPGAAGYLTDSTGNRRYWPVSVTRIDLPGIAAQRDQLWAEATQRYFAGERWWLEGRENAIASEQQIDREEAEPWVEPLRRKLGEAESETRRRLTELTADEALTLLGIPHERKDKKAQMRVATALKELGFERVKMRPDGVDGGNKGRPRWTWVRR